MSAEPRSITTTQFGKSLQEEYGDKDPNTPITYFMLLLGKQIYKDLEKDQVFRELERLGTTDVQRVTDKGWDNMILLILKFDGQFDCERLREREINAKVREILMSNLKTMTSATQLPPNTEIHAILTRACLYTCSEEEPSEVGIRQPVQPQIITTEEIGNILKNQYKIGNTPIDYFYLYIQVEDKGKSVRVDSEIVLSILTDFGAGDWRVLEEETWPGAYFGHFPKTSVVMTEREREMSLSEKVKEYLAAILTRKISKKQESQAKAHVIITRACDYTKQDQDPSSSGSSAMV